MTDSFAVNVAVNLGAAEKNISARFIIGLTGDFFISARCCKTSDAISEEQVIRLVVLRVPEDNGKTSRL